MAKKVTIIALIIGLAFLAYWFQYRLQKLEEASKLLKETLGVCEVVPKAYDRYMPTTKGYEDELDRCANTYIKLKNRL